MKARQYRTPGWLREDEVAAKLGRSVQSVRGLIYSGPLLGKFVDGVLSVREVDLKKFERG